MWEDIASFSSEELDAADRAYRRWARSRMRSGSLVGFILETVRSEPAASGCVWRMPVQPRPGARTTEAPYLLSMYTERGHRKNGLATRIVREAVRWARAEGYDLVVLHASRYGQPIYLRAGFTRTREMRLRLGSPPRRSRRRSRTKSH